jgi:hypothetical protein
MTVRRIRQSEIKTYKQCRRRWNWSYVKGLDKEDENARTSDTGTLFHAGRANYYLGLDPFVPIHAAKAEHIQRLEGGVLPKDWASTYELAEIMVEGFIDWVAETGCDADYRTLAVERRIEVEFATILGDTVVITGQLDHEVIHEPSGLHYLRDAKTVQSMDQAGRQLQVDDQLLTYAVLKMMEDGTHVAGAEHDMAKRVKRTATAKPPFYERVQVNFNIEQLRNHYRHMHGTLTEMIRAYQTLEANPDLHHDIAPPNPTKDCTWICPFIDVCVMADDGGNIDGALKDLYIPREFV